MLHHHAPACHIKTQLTQSTSSVKVSVTARVQLFKQWLSHCFLNHWTFSNQIWLLQWYCEHELEFHAKTFWLLFWRSKSEDWKVEYIFVPYLLNYWNFYCQTRNGGTPLWARLYCENVWVLSSFCQLYLGAIYNIEVHLIYCLFWAGLWLMLTVFCPEL